MREGSTLGLPPWVADGYLFPVPRHVIFPPCESVFVSTFPLFISIHNSHIELGPHLMTPYKLEYLHKYSASTYGHLLWYQELGLQHI